VSESPIRSQAQLAMLKRAVADTDYAKERGISAIHAQSLLDGHEAAGSPTLPERIEPSVGGPKSGKRRSYKLLGSS
jgi:hypothetical protein